MPLTPSQKTTREWPLLVLTLGIVGVICFPLWQGLAGDAGAMLPWSQWTTDRWARLLLGPEQIACYICFTWSAFILGFRYLEVRRQKQAFALDLLPTEEGARILQEDARPLQRKIDQVTGQRGPYVLVNMVRAALGKFALSKSSHDVSETIRTQGEVNHGRLVSSMSTVNYLAWAIPAIGFLGTVRGLAGSMTMAGQADQEIQVFIEQATRHLAVAFDCTLVALTLSLAAMFIVYQVQREEESLVIDCQQYCLDHLVNRIYEPEPVNHGTPLPEVATGAGQTFLPASAAERIVR